MKKINLNIIFIILFLLSTNIFAEIALLTSDSMEMRPINEMYSILKDFTDKHRDKNIVFYVHGRKKKLIDEWLKIPKIENQYNVKVVMLHWDSWDSLVTRPVKNAEIAADQLFESIETIKHFKNDNIDYFKEHALTMICHSMGNVILKAMVEKYYMNNPHQEKIFNNFVSVGADVPLIDHDKWLSQFNISHQNYVVMNDRDIVLLLSFTLDVREGNLFDFRLGLGLNNKIARKDNTKAKLSLNAKYIDVSKILASQHGYYLGQNKIMRNIFNNLLNGHDFLVPSEKQVQFKYEQDKLYSNYFTIHK